jgi:hypothetical protein
MASERSSVTVITANLRIVIAAVRIQTAAVWVRGQNCGEQKPKAESELYDC